MIDFFSVKPYEMVTKKVNDKDTEVKEVSDIPLFCGFAIKIDVDRDTLTEWNKKHKEFSLAYKKCKQLQENWLVTNGLRSNINTAFGIFTAKNILGWRDKVEQMITVDDIEFDDD